MYIKEKVREMDCVCDYSGCKVESSSYIWDIGEGLKIPTSVTKRARHRAAACIFPWKRCDIWRSGVPKKHILDMQSIFYTFYLYLVFSITVFTKARVYTSILYLPFDVCIESVFGKIVKSNYSISWWSINSRERSDITFWIKANVVGRDFNLWNKQGPVFLF